MLFTGLETVSYNINRKINRLKLFEFGKTYHQIEENRIEHKHLSILMTGKKDPENWLGSDEKLSFFDLKSVVENILERLGIQKWKISETSSDLFSEGINYNGRKETLVTFGVLSNKLLKKLDIKQEVLYADFNWDAMLESLKKEVVKFKEIPKFPEVSRDFALLVRNNVTFEQVAQTAKNAEKKYLKEVGLFDVYTGKNLPEGTKSYGVSFVLQDQNATLQEKQIDKIMHKLQSAFERDLEATLR
jgi:phenylalanyl-tRNA synthetase beta chain